MICLIKDNQFLEDKAIKILLTGETNRKIKIFNELEEVLNIFKNSVDG